MNANVVQNNLENHRQEFGDSDAQFSAMVHENVLECHEKSVGVLFNC